jgi:hypothetical protein
MEWRGGGEHRRWWGLVAVSTDAWVVGGKVVASVHHVASGITDLAVTKDGGKGRVTTAIRVGADCFGYDPCCEGGSNGGAHGGRGWREGDPTVLGVTADCDDFAEGGSCGGGREAITRVRRGKERGGAAGSSGERR